MLLSRGDVNRISQGTLSSDIARVSNLEPVMVPKRATRINKKGPYFSPVFAPRAGLVARREANSAAPALDTAVLRRFRAASAFAAVNRGRGLVLFYAAARNSARRGVDAQRLGVIHFMRSKTLVFYTERVVSVDAFWRWGRERRVRLGFGVPSTGESE